LKTFVRQAVHPLCAYLFGGLVTIGGGVAALRAFLSMAPK